MLFAISCGDHSPSGPKSVSPGHASFSILPSFPQIPVGGPSIRLARIVGVLTAANGESTTSEARFDSDSAVLAFDVPITGNSGEFTLELTAFDAQGVIVFHSIQKITLKPGVNDHLPSPELVYSAPDAGVTVLHVTPGTAQLAAGAGASFSVTGTGAGGQNISPIHVGWSSRDPSIATVDANGAVVAGKSQGSTWIVARTAMNVADSASVKVRAPVDKVTIAPGSATLTRGQSSSFSAELRDAGNHLIDDRTPAWSSSDPSVAAVSATGSVVALKIGTATISASAEGKTATATVTVVSPVDHVELAPASLTFASIGQSGSLTPKIVARAGASIDGITVSLSTSNPAVATVDSKGVVTATGNGAATITASADGSTATAAVTVKQVVASVTVSPKAASVSAIGDTRTFTATVADAIGNPIQSPAIAWTSSDQSIATVSGGTVVGKRAGSATITASIDGKSDAATFIVAPTARLLIVLTNKTQIQVGESATLSAALADNNGNVLGTANAIFTTNTSTVAQLSGNTLTGIHAGVAHVTATAGALTGTLDVRVIASTGLEVIPSTVERTPGGTVLFSVTNASSRVSWTVNGIPGGNSTYGTIDVEGFYRAPGSIPTPSTFDVCAVQTAPALQGCSHVTIRAVPSGGVDMIVINDLNGLQDGHIENENNQTFYKNIVSFTPTGSRATATKVLFQYGHGSLCASNICSPALTTVLRSDMRSVGISDFIDDNSAAINVIPIDVRVVFLMTPVTFYSAAEVNGLKSFAAGGGRIVYIGENLGYYVGGAQVENALLSDLGSGMSISGALVNCSNFTVDAAHIRAHQTTTGVTSLDVPCASGLSLGPNDYAIVLGQVGETSTFVPVIAALKVDVTPIVSEGGIDSERSRKSSRPLAATSTSTGRDTTGLGPDSKRPRP